MKYEFATLVATNVVAVNVRKLSQMLDRAETDGMLMVPLSASGNLPATHWISTGMMPSPYVNVLTDNVRLFTVAKKAWEDEGLVFPFTQPQVNNALSNCTYSNGTRTVQVDGVDTVVHDGPFDVMARLGLKMIQPVTP